MLEMCWCHGNCNTWSWRWIVGDPRLHFYRFVKQLLLRDLHLHIKHVYCVMSMTRTTTVRTIFWLIGSFKTVFHFNSSVRDSHKTVCIHLTLFIKLTYKNSTDKTAHQSHNQCRFDTYWISAWYFHWVTFTILYLDLSSC